MSTTRASRNSKEKPSKTQQTTQNVKTDGTAQANKNQPTAEQMRLATMISDKNEADPELKAKIVQVTELTGRKEDEALIALHDCDYDLNRAVERLLENEDDQGEWKEAGNKKKKNQINAKNQSADAVIADHKIDKREHSKDRDIGDRSESAPRGRRDRGPPRFQRAAAGRGKENDNRTDSNSRERSYERGRGRGRGGSSGPGRGRGRGKGPGRFERGGLVTGGSSSRFEKGPQIDTWTNETAANAEKDNIGAWGDMSEDWTADEWTGSLEESKVFTPSVSSDAPKNMFSSVNDNDAKMFTAPPPIDTQHNSIGAPSAIGQSGSLANSLGSSSLGQNSIGQNSLGQNSLGQGLNTLAHLLQQSVGKQPPDISSSASQQQYMSQYAKEATESIKNAVGIGSSSSSSQPVSSQGSQPSRVGANMAVTVPGNNISGPPTRVGQAVPSGLGQHRMQAPPKQQPPPPQQQQQQQHQQQQQQQQQQNQRPKMPPPSKIPASAVEMPGSMNFNLDVQFGNWDIPSDIGFSFGSAGDSVVTSNNYTGTSMCTSSVASSLTNDLSQSSVPGSSSETTGAAISTAMSQTSSSKPPTMSSLDGLSQPTSQSPRTAVYQNANSNTPPKEPYSQSTLTQGKMSSPPEPIPFPTADRKSSPYGSQRQGQSAGSVSSNKGSGAAQQLSYNQSGYAGNSYQSSSYKPSSLSQSTSGYTHVANSLTSGNMSAPGQYGSSYQASFQNQTGYHNNQNQSSSLYQGSTNQTGSFQTVQSSSGYPSQNSGYQSQSASYDRSQTSGYHSSRDSTSGSGSSYPVSQSNSAYQSGVSQTAGSTYQREAPSSQSTYSGYSAVQQNSLQNAQMASSKLENSLGNMTVKDSALDNATAKYDGSTSAASLTTTTATTSSSSVANGQMNISANLGLGPASVPIASAGLNNSKSVAPATTSKAPPNLPPGVPLIGHNYMTIGQHGMPFAAFGLAAQQPMYSYEDLQLLQPQRLPMHGYYDMPLQQQPPTTMTGRDGQANLTAAAPYTAVGSGGEKLNRVEAQSPVNAQTSQQTAQSALQQQAFINPTLPPGYNYYYPAGVLPAPYSYPPSVYPESMMLQVPSVTNAAHGSTNASAQFQKPGAYGSHAYGTGAQGQDFKTYGSGAQSANKAVAAAAAATTVTSSGTDLVGAGTGYGKTHTQSFDKSGYHAGTPPPFNLALPSGTQAGPLGAPAAAYGTPYVPMVAQPHHYHAQLQDSSVVSGRGSQQGTVQAKPASAKNYNTTNYWAN